MSLTEVSNDPFKIEDYLTLLELILSQVLLELIL